MSVHLEREINILKKKLLSLAATVEESVWEAVKAVKNRDSILADKIVEDDLYIDHMEVDIEEDCLKILALHQPVAIDLRFIIAVLKINNDLERVGDKAVSMARVARKLAAQGEINVPFDLAGMAEKVQSMLRDSIDSLVKVDTDLAREVCSADAEVDAINKKMYEQVKKCLGQHPEWFDRLLHYLSISRNLERIGDHATNIAEDVIYMIEGEIVRHKPEELKTAVSA
jgi:phosphate transport system protein